MAKLVRRSPEFGRWVRETRRAVGKSQADLAESASLTQQYLSRIESQGLVPTDDDLERICEALGRDVRDVRDILARTSKSDEYAQWLQKEFDDFRVWLVGLTGPVHIYILRDTPEVVNPVTVDLHCSILKERRDLYISILFRRGAADLRSSFEALASNIDDSWSADPEVKKKWKEWKGEPQRRIFGYYRNPKIEEGVTAIPMAMPVILVKLQSDAHLFCYESHPEIFDIYKQTGEGDYLARLKSIVLLPTPPEKATQFQGWIGGSHTDKKLSPHKWVSIDWPE